MMRAVAAAPSGRGGKYAAARTPVFLKLRAGYRRSAVKAGHCTTTHPISGELSLAESLRRKTPPPQGSELFPAQTPLKEFVEQLHGRVQCSRELNR